MRVFARMVHATGNVTPETVLSSVTGYGLASVWCGDAPREFRNDACDAEAVRFFAVSSDHHRDLDRSLFMRRKCVLSRSYATGRPAGNTIVCVVAGAGTIAYPVEECLDASTSNAEPAVKAS
jgi:hypothetical protein